MKKGIRLAWEGLFLNEAPYAEMRDNARPVLRGLVLVLLIAVTVALVGFVGTALEWATTPRMSAIKEIVLEGLQDMPWYRELRGDPQFEDQFQQWYDLGWRVFPRLFGAPDLAAAGLRIVLLPVGLVFAWLLYGLVAHLFARLLGGQGSLGQTLGSTALAATPQMLNLMMLLPYVAVGGVVTGAWTLLCRYVALKTGHRLTWSRALAAALLPYLAFALLLALFGCLGGAVVASVFGGGVSR